MEQQLTNGQKIHASFDVFDQKGKRIATYPTGTVVAISGGDAGGPTGVAQWAPDNTPDNGVGTITTEGDNLGDVVFTGTVTYPDGTVFNSGEALTVHVINSPPNSAAFTLGSPENE